MCEFTRINNVELIGPTSVAVRLADEHDGSLTERLVVSPNDFLTDFATFLTAVRAAGETRPVEQRRLEESWQAQRRALRRRLVDGDPWGARTNLAGNLPEKTPSYWALVLCMGEEKANRLLRERQEEAEPVGANREAADADNSGD
jgi:hypothetical protein